jgi:spore cortex formation protein SpoVR/YcgB (stage V sporulation)
MLTLGQEEPRARAPAAHREQIYNDLWRTVPKSAVAAPAPDDLAERKKLLQLPEENLLYFIEKTAPKLETWQREILRIVRNLAQYFYPQKQTKVMNEGCATFVHYNIMHRLHETGGLSDGVMLEMLHAHTSVIAQPDFDDKRFTSLNPYALGFGMMCDIARIATAPTEEDRTWFPAFAGNGDPWGTLRGVWADYRDESFVLPRFMTSKATAMSARHWRSATTSPRSSPTSRSSTSISPATGGSSFITACSRAPRSRPTTPGAFFSTSPISGAIPCFSSRSTRRRRPSSGNTNRSSPPRA